MKRKVVIEPEDYQKIAVYIESMPVPFARIEQAAEIKVILRRVQLMDIEVKEQDKT